MTTFILVPVGWHGEWNFETVVPLLERVGHHVHALTLTGLRPDDGPETVAAANLDTHAEDILRLLDRARLSDVTLVGHSYAGMVIAAAADRAPDLISRLVHIDAYVPRDGESCWSETSPRFRELFVAGAAADGYAVQPPPGGDPRRRPHPLASFTQAVRLTGAGGQIPRRDFVYCSSWEDLTPFADLRMRLRADPGWNTYDFPTGHDPMRENPALVADLLLSERAACWTSHTRPQRLT